MEVIRALHVLGALTTVALLTALWGASLKGPASVEKTLRIRLAILHGLGMAGLLLTGLHLLTGVSAGGWLVLKLTIWLALGASMILAKRKAHWGLGLPVLWLLLAGLAAYLGISKPF